MEVVTPLLDIARDVFGILLGLSAIVMVLLAFVHSVRGKLLDANNCLLWAIFACVVIK